MLLKLLFASSLALVSCASVEIPEFKAHVVNPYEQNCYGVNVITLEDEVLPKAACYRGVVLFSEDYAKIKKAFYKSCLNAKCKQSVEVLDQLFITIDKAVAEVYGVQ